MDDGTSLPAILKLVLDPGGPITRCADMSMGNLISAAMSASTIRPASQTGRVTPAMSKLISCLEAARDAGWSDQFNVLCCAIQESRDEVHQTSRLRVLAGFAPDESTLFVSFVSPWHSRCLVEAIV